MTFVELIGGILLIVGLLWCLAAFLLTTNLVVAILLVKVNVGLLSSLGGDLPGAELDVALIARFLVILLVGPGKLSLDHAHSLEEDAGERMSARG